MTKSDSVAIVGMSSLFPGASNLDAFWQNMLAGRVSLREVPADRWNHSAFYSPDRRNADATYARKISCLDDIRSFGPEQYGMPPRRAYPMDPQQRLFLDQTRVALDDAGYRGRPLPKATGVYVGASAAEYRDLVLSRFRARQILGGEWGSVPQLPASTVTDAVRNVQPAQKYTMIGLLMNMIASNVSGAFDVQGPAMVMDAACSSALVAVHGAVLHLRAGVCDAAIVGGVYTICTPDLLIGFSRIGALSGNDVCRPFDEKADGFVLGEGVGVIVLKRLEDAVRDRDHIWAVIQGVGLNNDGHGEGPMTPRFSGQVDALARAYRDAGISPNTVAYVEAHGTATPVGDMTEIAALKENVKESGGDSVRCAVSSVKGNIGHSLAASGIAGLIRAALAVHHRIIPPQAGLQSVRAKLGLEGSGFHIPATPEPFEARPGAPRRAGVSAFGFGGTNVHVVLEEPPESAQRTAMVAVSGPRDPQLFVISAATPDHLVKHLAELAESIETTSTSVRDLAYTLTVGRRRESVCVGFVARNRSHLLEMLRGSIAVVAGGQCNGVFYSREPLPASQWMVTLLFPDDGNLFSQFGAHLSDCFPALRARLEATDSKLDPLPEFPPLSHTGPSKNGSAAPASSGSNGSKPGGGQPWFAAAQHAFVDFLSDLGLRPEVKVCGDNPKEIVIHVSARKPGDPHQLIRLFREEEDPTEGLLNALGVLAAKGIPLKLASLFGDAKMASLPTPSFPSRPYWIMNKTRPSERRGNDLAASFEVAPEAFSLPDDDEMGADERVAVPAAFEIGAATPQRVLDVIIQLSGFPIESLKPDVRFGADLGFDSLMWMDLYDSLISAIPEARDIPESLISADTTVGDLIREVSAAVSRSGQSPEHRSVEGDIQRYRVVPVDKPLSQERSCALRFDGPVVMVADSLGVAPILAQRLRDADCEVRTIPPGEYFARSGARALIDLSGLNPETGANDAAALRMPVIAMLERASAMAADAAAPTAFIAVHAGIRNAGVAGLAKAMAHEWPKAFVKSIEVGQDAAPEVIAERILEELGGPAHPVEISYASGSRQVLALEKQALNSRTLADGVVVAISGGGRGLGAELSIELARRHKARLLLLGRSGASEDTVRSIVNAGGEAVYVSCDVRNTPEVVAAFQRCREVFGPVQYVVHAAGILDDGLVQTKDLDRAIAVFDTKVAGGLALWEASKKDPLAAFLMYGSWAGRFGNAHQSDYSAANHLLGRMASVLGADRPEVRVITLDLPPWEESGMVNGLPEPVRRALRSRVRFLTDQEGLTLVLSELSGEGPSGEVIIGAGLEEGSTSSQSVISVSRTEQPWLDDHRLDGRILVPLAVTLDYGATEAARLGLGPGFVLSNIIASEAFLVPDTGAIHLKITANPNHKGIEIGIRSEGHVGVEPPLRLNVNSGSDSATLLSLPPGGKAPDLPIPEFYQRLNFHGPRFRVLTSVLEVGPAHAVGQIRVPDYQDGPGGTSLHVLCLDGMMQLCAYWALVNLGVTGLPVGADEIRILARPVEGTELHIVGLLRNSAEGTLTSDLDLLDSNQQAILQIRGLRCKLINRKPLLHGKDDDPVVRPATIDSASWKIGEFPEVKALKEMIDTAQTLGIQSPYFSVHERVTNETSLINGREYINFSSYNYLGLSGHPEITAAAVEALNRYGTSVSASRLVSGEKPLHGELEREIAGFLGCEDAIAMVSGHATNVSLIGHLFGPKDLVIHDSLAHDSILSGIQLSGAKRQAFPHNNPDALDQILRRTRHAARRVLIAVEAVYSMDGDIAPLAPIIEVKRRHNALLLVDEAHSLGVLGQTGRGIGEHLGIDRNDVEFWMGTLSKSLASCGGYIAGSKELVRYLKYSNPGFVYSVGMSPANAAAALAALRKLRVSPELVAMLRERGRVFLEMSRKLGINTGSSEGTPIIPCIVGNSMDCIRLSRAMSTRGINVQPILHPAVEENMTRLRFFVTSRHTEQQIRGATEALAEELEKINPRYLISRPRVEPQRNTAARIGV